MKNNLFDIVKKIIITTGGYGILGTSISKYLASQGAIVVILGRNQIKRDALVNQIVCNGDEALFIKTDVLDEKSLVESRQTILQKYGKIIILVNPVHGNMPGSTIPPDKNIFDHNINDFRTVVDLNLFGTALPTSIFSRAMIQLGKGVILNLSSMSALRPLISVVGYRRAKATISNYHNIWEENWR